MCGSGRVVSKMSKKYIYIYNLHARNRLFDIIHKDKKLQHCHLLSFNYLFQHKDVLFEQKAVARETIMLASELKSHLVDKLKDSAAGKTKSHA